MITILIISIVIVLVVLLLAVGTTSKAYQFKHTVDPIKPEILKNEEPEINKQKDSQE
ncbi:MAG TPA: YtzI protein [Pseudoneobacillus sp.]|nr:YtzI protein [Pseudoneobacillus sp.]